MSPVDGNWGGTEENGTATVDTSSLAPGQHYILVHARNNAGKWGPFTAVFVDTTASEAPVAGFIFAPDPPHAGETILFTDTSTASPTEFFWDFGDGATSTIEDPTHVFSSTGTFIVTHIVTNTLGSDGVTQSLQVLPVDAASVDLTLGTPAPINPGDLVAFDALIAPPDAAPPFNYSINYGDGTVITDTVSVVNFPLLHAYASGGTFTVTLKVWNNSMTPEGAVSDTLVVLINPQYRLYLPIVTK
jgi:PKD repeat protein